MPHLFAKKEKSGYSHANIKVQNNRNSNKKAAYVFKGVFQIATMISDFDLRLSFLGKKIQRSADSLKSMFAEVASSSEEISTSTSQIVNANSELSESILRISEDAELLSRNTEKSNNILESIKAENTEMMVFSRDMDQSVQDLLNVIQKINEAIQGINDISDQTKLLSLNASIEAARAGASGKGFAVVADEIRALSTTTKELTANIDGLLIEMNDASNKSKTSVTQTLTSIGKIGGSIETVSTVMTESTHATEQISLRISEVAQTSRGISDSLQESSSALEAVNADIQNLSVSAEELQNISASIHEISVSIGEIGGTVNTLAVTAGEMVASQLCGLTNEDFIETVEKAISAHRTWVQKVRNMAKELSVAPIQTDEHKCGFGHFYYAVKPTSTKLIELWNSVEAIHHNLHKTGDAIIGFVEKKDSRRALEAVQKAEILSEHIVAKFNEMIRIAKEMSLSGEFIF